VIPSLLLTDGANSFAIEARQRKEKPITTAIATRLARCRGRDIVWVQEQTCKMCVDGQGSVQFGPRRNPKNGERWRSRVHILYIARH
jgi:hypothetical protein